MHTLSLDQNFNACLRTEMQRKFRQLGFLVDSVPGVDLPVLLKLFRAADVRSALPLEYYYQSSQVRVPIIFSSTFFKNLVSIKSMLITLARVISKDSSNIILRSIVRFNFIINTHSFVIIVIIYVVL